MSGASLVVTVSLCKGEVQPLHGVLIAPVLPAVLSLSIAHVLSITRPLQGEAGKSLHMHRIQLEHPFSFLLRAASLPLLMSQVKVK